MGAARCWLWGAAIGLIWLASAGAKGEEVVRRWTDRTGRQQIDARYAGLGSENNQVQLQPPDGEMLLVPIGQLSETDQEYIRAALLRATQALADAFAKDLEPSGYQIGRQIATLADRAVNESSGLACSRCAPELFWTHNDSGDGARLYAFSAKGEACGAFLLTGVTAFDWEDMVSFTRQGKPWLLVGDVGNNSLAAAVQVLYLVEEPRTMPADATTPTPLEPARIIHFSYEDDHRNCEALAYDAKEDAILLATKERDQTSRVYALAWPEPNDPPRPLVARHVATVPMPPVTGMDISPDGLRMVLLSYGDAYLFHREAGETWATALARKPRVIRLPLRIQGESICFGADDQTLYLTSEKLPTPLIEVRPLSAE